jgi:hypothetical protein
MSEFRHSPDNDIYFDNYRIPLSFFITQEPEYSLPSGMNQQWYVQGSLYVATDGITEKRFEMPNEIIESYISNKDIYIAAYELYISTPQDVSSAKLIKQTELENKYNATVRGGVVYGANIYDSSMYNILFDDLYLFTNVGEVPTGYTVRNNFNTPISLTLAQLKDIISLMQMLQYLSRINKEILATNLAALDTIEDVMAFNVNVGWQTVPYDPA